MKLCFDPWATWKPTTSERWMRLTNVAACIFSHNSNFPVLLGTQKSSLGMPIGGVTTCHRRACVERAPTLDPCWRCGLFARVNGRFALGRVGGLVLGVGSRRAWVRREGWRTCGTNCGSWTAKNTTVPPVCSRLTGDEPRMDNRKRTLSEHFLQVPRRKVWWPDLG